MKQRNGYRSNMCRYILAISGSVAIWFWSVSAMAQGDSLAASETTISGGSLVIITYMVLWLLFGAVLLLVLRRQRTLQREMDNLEERIDEVLGTAGGDEEDE